MNMAARDEHREGHDPQGHHEVRHAICQPFYAGPLQAVTPPARPSIGKPGPAKGYADPG
jgi:hypothetical protein